MKWQHEYLKDEYLELRKQCPKVRGSKPVYTAEMFYKLRDMAEYDIVPDGRFSDEECNLWCTFHSFHPRD